MPGKKEQKKDRKVKGQGKRPDNTEQESFPKNNEQQGDKKGKGKQQTDLSSQDFQVSNYETPANRNLSLAQFSVEQQAQELQHWQQQQISTSSERKRDGPSRDGTSDRDIDYIRRQIAEWSDAERQHNHGGTRQQNLESGAFVIDSDQPQHRRDTSTARKSWGIKPPPLMIMKDGRKQFHADLQQGVADLWLQDIESRKEDHRRHNRSISPEHPHRTGFIDHEQIRRDSFDAEERRQKHAEYNNQLPDTSPHQTQAPWDYSSSPSLSIEPSMTSQRHAPGEEAFKEETRERGSRRKESQSLRHAERKSHRSSIPSIVPKTRQPSRDRSYSGTSERRVQKPYFPQGMPAVRRSHSQSRRDSISLGRMYADHAAEAGYRDSKNRRVTRDQYKVESRVKYGSSTSSSSTSRRERHGGFDDFSSLHHGGRPSISTIAEAPSRESSKRSAAAEGSGAVAVAATRPTQRGPSNDSNAPHADAIISSSRRHAPVNSTRVPVVREPTGSDATSSRHAATLITRQPELQPQMQSELRGQGHTQHLDEAVQRLALEPMEIEEPSRRSSGESDICLVCSCLQHACQCKKNKKMKDKRKHHGRH